MTNEVLEIMEKAFKESAGKMGYTGDKELRATMILNHVTAELKKREIEVDAEEVKKFVEEKVEAYENRRLEKLPPNAGI